MPAELDYFLALIHLMSVLCEDKSNATESKVQNYFPINHINQLIEISGNCYYITKELMFFYNHVYLDTERENNEE